MKKGGEYQPGKKNRTNCFIMMGLFLAICLLSSGILFLGTIKMVGVLLWTGACEYFTSIYTVLGVMAFYGGLSISEKRQKTRKMN